MSGDRAGMGGTVLSASLLGVGGAWSSGERLLDSAAGSEE